MEIALVILLAIIFSAYFSGMEIAFLSSNKLRIEIDKKVGIFGSGIIASFSRKPERFIVTMLIGNNIALVIYGLYIAMLLDSALANYIRSDFMLLLIQTLISALVILVLAEFLPRAFFRNSPNLLLRTFSIPTAIIYGIFYPLTIMIIELSNILLRLFFGVKKEESKKEKVFGKIDLDDLVNEVNEDDNNTDLEEHDIKIFQKALDLSNVKLRACMVPRTEIVALQVKSSLDDLKQKFIDTGHSNILIYEDSIDNIIGYFRLRDLFNTPAGIREGIRSLPIVPESMAANNLLKLFVEQNKKLALVVDEFGGTSGMITLEDVLEEIVGDIEDEHDSSALTEKQLSPGEYLFSGRMEIDYLNEEYGLKLPESDEYETLAGLIMVRRGNIPKLNTTTEIGNYIIKVVRLSETRIELLNLKRKK